MSTDTADGADAAVIEASLRDAERFAVIYDRYAAQLYRYAHRRVTVGIVGFQATRGGDQQVAAPAESPTGAPADAAELLHRVALVANSKDAPIPRTNQFVYRELVSEEVRYAQEAPADSPTSATTREQRWDSADGTRDGKWVHRYHVEGQEEQVSESPMPGCRNGRRLSPDGQGGTTSEKCTPDPAYRAGLPETADAMLAHLRREGEQYRGLDCPSSLPGGASLADMWALEYAIDLALHAYLTPPVQAALFEAVSKLPGLTVGTNAVDLAGRRGIPVGLAIGTIRSEFVFDAQSYEFLGTRSVIAKADPESGIEKGAYAVAVLRVAVVDRVGQTP